MNKDYIGGICGTILSGIGLTLQTNELLEIISFVITILGGLITMVIAIVNFIRHAKADGKIDTEEAKEIVEIVKDGIEDIKEDLDKKE